MEVIKSVLNGFLGANEQVPEGKTDWYVLSIQEVSAGAK